MKAWNDTVVCVTTKAIYEYRDGKTVNALSVRILFMVEPVLTVCFNLYEAVRIPII